MGKEEIAHNEQFLLFPQCFLLNQVIVFPFVHIFDIIFLFAAELEGAKICICGKGLTTLKKKAKENNVGKGENAGDQHFLLFPVFCTVLTLSQTTNFRLFQSERVCRRQFQI